MGYTIRTRNEHLQNDGTAKRILALDGGGLRGILTLGILAEVESLLRERHGGDEAFRLSHYFDLIAGTSTGSIIATCLALGMSVSEIVTMYLALGKSVFEKSFLRQGLLRAKYDERKLSEELKRVFGAETTLESDTLETGLLVVTKRLDTGSTWPISNNPNGKYYAGGDDESVIPNKDYPLWRVVRASTAAPSFFDPERIDIAKSPGKNTVHGEFVDGGVSPFNNPALQALMFATLSGYRVGWPTGADRLFLVSVGTGSRDPSVSRSSLAAAHALQSLVSLMEDCASLVETVMQWLSTSATAREIDSELGNLDGDLIAREPLLSYSRYNVTLDVDSLAELGLDVSPAEAAVLTEMDDPDNMEKLKDIGERVGKRDVRRHDFPPGFDLTA